MIRKSAGLLFVLIANILLVVHGILPHQHQGGFAWIPAEHYEDHHDPAGSHAEDADHKHQDHDHDQSCLLAQAYLVPINASRFDCPMVNHQNPNPDLHFIFTYSNSSGYLPSLYKIPVPPLLPPGSIPRVVSSCSGLRAPPAL